MAIQSYYQADNLCNPLTMCWIPRPYVISIFHDNASLTFWVMHLCGVEFLIVWLFTAELPFFLRHPSMNGNRWEVLLHQKLCQSYTPLDRLHKDDNLNNTAIHSLSYCWHLHTQFVHPSQELGLQYTSNISGTRVSHHCHSATLTHICISYHINVTLVEQELQKLFCR